LRCCLGPFLDSQDANIASGNTKEKPLEPSGQSPCHDWTADRAIPITLSDDAEADRQKANTGIHYRDVVCLFLRAKNHRFTGTIAAYGMVRLTRYALCVQVYSEGWLIVLPLLRVTQATCTGQTSGVWVTLVLCEVLGDFSMCSK